MTDPAATAFPPLAFRLESWAAWLPGHDTLACGGTPRPASDLPASVRRRVTPIGRKALEAAWRLLGGWSGEPPRIILSSRHGEYERTFGLLGALADTAELSPAAFSLSVHHALVGLLSIATRNRAGHGAVAGGAESFGYGCLEAAACLAEGDDRVLLLHFDEALPDAYARIGGEAEAALALALLLAPEAETAAGERLEMDCAPSSSPDRDSLALGFARLLDGNAAEARAVGPRLSWRWRRA